MREKSKQTHGDKNGCVFISDVDLFQTCTNDIRIRKQVFTKMSDLSLLCTGINCPFLNPHLVSPECLLSKNECPYDLSFDFSFMVMSFIAGRWGCWWQMRLPHYIILLLKLNIYEDSVVFTLVWFYGISTIVGYLMPNSFYTYKQFYLKQFSLVWV